MIDSKFIGHSLSWTTVDGWFTYTFIYTLGRIRCVLRFIRTSKKNSLKSTSESKIKKFEKNVAHWINFDGNSFFLKGRIQSAFDHERKMTNYLNSVRSAQCMVLFKINGNYWRWSEWRLDKKNEDEREKLLFETTSTMNAVN